MNRLANEKSPYLLQHSENPVNWYAWGKEAFEKAKEEDKPILLSIGYSTCHWCHVMAHESFEDEKTAKILNENFVCIKVDREERPDIDAVYMKVCQAMTGSGGWPLTVFMTPEQKPFFAGTYFPKNNRYGQIGLTELSQKIAYLWENDRENLLKSSDEIVAAITSQNSKTSEPNEKLFEKAYKIFRMSFDEKYGGFGPPPKFPTPHNLLFLMKYGDTEMYKITLNAMAKGGIFDQIGGGFSRYSTDRMWLIPHFEKMLYDNALLIIAYSEGYKLTKNEFYYDTAKRTAEYILRELRSPEGGCFCGQDADSNGVEGGYYTFKPEEIKKVLGEKDGSDFCNNYNITDDRGIPNLIGKEYTFPDREQLRKLYEYRKNRTSLHVDDKILLSWNAWTIIAFLKSGYIDESVEIYKFIEKNMTDENNRLYVRYRDGEAKNDGQLDDYAVYSLALVTLYKYTLDVNFLEQALFRAKQMLEFFEDKNGGFFLTPYFSEQLIDRPKETYDGAIPSGNSVAAAVLETLAQLTGETFFRNAADRQMKFVAGQAEDYPAGYCFSLLAIYKALYPEKELIVCGEEIPEELDKIKTENFNILFKSSKNADTLSKCAPFTKDYPVSEHGIRAYLCENGACKKSDTNLKSLFNQA